MLDKLLSPALAAVLDEVPTPHVYRGPAELDALLDDWQGAGVRVDTLGWARSGRPIRCAVFGSSTKTFLAWGYPHPDEPFGGEALAFLGSKLVQGPLPGLEDWRFCLILCADPDETERNEIWMKGPRDAATFVRGAWRPTHLGIEVDYGFPLDYDPWTSDGEYVGRCRSRAECLVNCGGGPCTKLGTPYNPLPESLALAEAIDRFQPDVVASMHSTHTGGDYTFLLEKESPAVLDDLVAIPRAVGRVRHLGEPIDRGRQWRRATPDLIQERNLEYFKRALMRKPIWNPDYLYVSTHSAGAYVQAQGRGAQFICPESTQFLHEDFGDPHEWENLETVRISVEDRKSGRWRLVRILVNGEWIVAEQTPAEKTPLADPVETKVAQTRGMLGVRALAERRRQLARSDEIWDEIKGLPDLAEHPYLDERWRLRVPGAYVSDQAMKIFRLRDDYRKAATIAQAACFRWRWPLHTASMIGNFQNFLAAQDLSRPALAAAKADLDALQDDILSELPPQLTVEADGANAVRSQLARCFRIMLARS